MLKYYLAFNRSRYLGALRIRQILNYFGDIKQAWESERSEYIRCGLPESIVNKFWEEKKNIDPDHEIELLEAHNLKAVCLDDEDYPSNLKELSDSPAVFYYKGILSSDYDNWSISIVGTRKITSYGRQATRAIVEGLLQYNIPIISGLALGVDGYAHRVCVEKHRRTIAVLGSGLDKIYPLSHTRLAEKIIEEGGLTMSEFAPGIPGYKSNFPYRNRVIAGFSKAVAVIEADISSGSLITAKAALEYGRDVFSLPGPIFSSQSRGTNLLIRQGAIPLTSYEDIIEYLNIKRVSLHRQAREVIPDNEQEAAVIDVLKNENSLHVDDIARKTNLPVNEINSLLISMQLKGKVVNTSGMYYALSR